VTRVRVSVEGAIGRLTLARPEKKNALDRAMAEALLAGLETLGRDATVRVVVLDADGPDFCAGADLEALEQMIDAPPEVHRDDALALGRVFLTMRALAKPMVAVVRGRALAGGAGLATACDVVLAHQDASFGYPEVRVGFVPAMVMTMLRRCVGEKHAAELVLSGRVIGAADAERLGIASRVFARDTFDAEVAASLFAFATAAPDAVGRTKRLFYAQDGMSFSEGIAAGAEENVAARGTEQFREGVRAFLAARPRKS
jgi:methylglutaconyl-CoA hydratase